MTCERKVVRLDESQVVVVRRVPMTGETCDQLRAIRKIMEKRYYDDHGTDVELPYPVLINWIVTEYYDSINRGDNKDA